ncbi:ABC transporter ATP-binding protein YhcG [Helicobacter sp. NHP19-012]|uniref:ABC transporter ATP-binding protein YhcG n=1 Tax=Helicobacter gastrofelis TaxID=2849642 RepID=A0ABM7SED3_9HELI|nr:MULTISPECIES: ABC transporter ATP-binding protein [unclassified Helicobacter]BCZ18735.1 ABC transporter ATP-binding protein YhcG [Helicobacter sp. NHP19-012]GMB96151.1 ABC transporter ATP-binding protein YhcG [Helicobacter sp. NHP22-001]
MLVVENLSKSYGSKVVLHGISFSLEGGQIVGLLGANGAGKSSLLKILAGLLREHGGLVSLQGQAIGLESKKITAYCPDRPIYPPSHTAHNLLNLCADFFSDFDKDKALDLIERFKLPLDLPFKSFSKGQKERLQLIFTLSRRAQLFLFDEPLGGIDPLGRQEILDLITKERGQESTILIATHLVHDIQDCLDKALFLQNGGLVAFETTATLKNRHGSVEQAYKDLMHV